GQRLLLWLQAAHYVEDALTRLLDADHGAGVKHGGRWVRSVPTSAEPHRQAGGCPLDALDVLDAFGDGVAELVEVVCLHLDDDVVGSGHRVNAHDLGVGVLEFDERLADALGPPDFSFDEYVTA